MDSKYNQNGILTGFVDSFCLVCESHLRSEDDAISHIEKPVHIKNLNSCPYFNKFTGDHIRKVKKGYFCEFCNLLLPTAAKVGLHVTESSHNDNKGAQLIKRSGNNVIVFSNIFISEEAWNGLMADTCAVCNMEFNNLKLHMTDQKHVLNLIQKKVEFGEETMVYRQIDDTAGHCLICNLIIALNTLQTHYKDEIHKTHVDEGQKLYQSFFENNKPSENIAHKDIQKEKNNTSKATETVSAKVTETPTNKKSDTAIKTIELSESNFSDSDSDYEDIDTTDSETNNQDEFIKLALERAMGVMFGGRKACEDMLGKAANKKNSAANKMKDKQIPKTSTNSEKVGKDKKSPDSVMDCACKEIHKSTAKINNKYQGDINKIFEQVLDFQKNGININFENETAFCKKCFESVDLDIEVIENHIKEHNTNPKTVETANTAHTMNENHSRTALNSIDKDEKKNKPVNFDQNHNETKTTQCKTQKELAEEKEEIIKIDLTKKSEDIEENENNALVKYDPSMAKAEPEKSTSKPAPKPAADLINDPEVFANEHSLTYNKGNGNAFCRICNTRVPATIKNMKEHVSGNSHKTKTARLAEIEKTKKLIPKKPMGKFITWRSTVMNVFGVDDVILNDKFCLTRMSYFMITTQKRLRCQACEVNLTEEQVSNHVDGVFHERAMERTPVVTCLDNEFVREVRLGLFHCGFCNLMVGPWEDVSKHLKCSDHRENKRVANSRLSQHLPDILEHRANRQNIYKNAFPQIWPGFF